MGVIRRLDPTLSNMIAAGEVVERPAAVVKELVENALDAEAKYIQIKIENGGIQAIEVSDDGKGMDESDALMAFERHSTSKIQTEFDLFAPKTLGFRGEALPSIASVSLVTLKTHNGERGTKVQIAYGDLVEQTVIGMNRGTDVRVEGLFVRTPARLKYLKSPRYEASLITALVERFALSHPDVAFKLQDEDKVLLNTRGNGDLLEVFANCFGNRLARFAHPFSFENADFKVSGLWVDPQENRANNQQLFFFINHRMVRSWRLQKAVMEAYSSYLMHGRYPIAVLHIEMDEQLVDVNVHPSKWEIRLSKEIDLNNLVQDELNRILKESMGAKTYQRHEKTHEQDAIFNIDHFQVKETQAKADPLEFAWDKARQAPHVEEPLNQPVENSHAIIQPEKTMAEEISEEVVKPVAPQFPQLDVIGQMHGRYILASSSDALYVIDQHAAKERVNYELILNSLQDNDEHPLLMPIEVEVSAGLMQKFDAFNEVLSELQVEAEIFSPNSFVIRSIPSWMKSLEINALIHDMADQFEKDSAVSQKSLRNSVIANMACHRSIRFNQVLDMEAMKHIVWELSQCEQPFNCPHGRPTLIKIEAKQLWNEFER